MQASDSDLLVIDNELLRRFGGRGPRYTSYPTADRFDDRVGPERYGQALQARAARRGEPLGLYVHIPFCRSICYYCACNKIGTKHASAAAPYLAALEREVALVTALTGTGQPISHLHFGGGTPTFISDEELGALIDMLHRSFEFRDDGEYSIEVDPRTVSPRRAHALRAMGLNRVSLGVQDFDPVVQAAVNRIQPYRQTVELMEAARAAGFRSINVDLIYGLPKQHHAGFEETVRKTIAAGPDRIALYHYAHLPALFKPQRRIAEADLPSSEEKARMFEAAVAMFEAAGYRHLGLDHFARDDDELAVARREGRLHRNFQGYCSHDSGDLIALGVSAISSIGDVYAQNDKVLDGYYRRIERGELPVVRGIALDADDFVRRDAINALMCNFRLDWDALDARRGIDSRRWLAGSIEALAPLVQAGAVRVDERGVEVLARGRLLVRAVAMAFDRHLAQSSSGASYSRIA
ncbi:MAG: oxygen-independent coproporphyrinogen III oxidase [Burkholderiales bacterium]|nr:oxygen-independent coproporphyrinogen III oxidase [Burkholderiales bacterium]OJX07411.1 MAG: oxygen-independent coproporphyrinogen III oxidase [Burkholderiales bacterium 70-64]